MNPQWLDDTALQTIAESVKAQKIPPGEVKVFPVVGLRPCVPIHKAAGRCVIVKTPHLQDGDRAELFHAEDEVDYVEPGVDMLDLLVDLGMFPSRGQARKNWRGPIEIPAGWTE